jgi:hypothetical protein
MSDVIDIILGSLAIVLCGAAFALGGPVLRQAWRAAFKPPADAQNQHRGRPEPHDG